jgi:hypothetical protein
MPPLSSLILPVTFAVAFLGIAIVLMLALRPRRRGQQPSRAARRETVELECRICHNQMIFSKRDLVPLAPSEVALVVRTNPSLVGHTLHEYVCPFCEASHCFEIVRAGIQWVAVNSYNPQTITGNCMECGKRFLRPPWPRGQYDERVNEVAQPRDDYGLICSRCGARCCWGCCRGVTATTAVALHCPRCRRAPVDRFVHF